MKLLIALADVVVSWLCEWVEDAFAVEADEEAVA